MKKGGISTVVFLIIEKVDGQKGIPLLQEKNRPEPRMWKLPGGTVEQGEYPELTAYRESQEETGLLIKRLCNEDIIFDEQKKGRFGPYRFVVYRAEYMRGITLLGDEVEKMGFFSPKEVRALLEQGEIVPTHAPALHKWLLEQKK